MGLLDREGQEMAWDSEETKKAVPYVRDHGIIQFVNIFNRYKDKSDYPFLWGEEVEHLMMKKEGAKGDEKRSVKLVLRAADMLLEMQKSAKGSGVDYRPEYGSFMVESVPEKPYDLTPDSLVSCEANIAMRNAALAAACAEGEVCLTLVSFPLMGVGHFTEKGSAVSTKGKYSESIFVPDECINHTHPRFGTLTANIRKRRGRKVCIQIPLFIDANTLSKTVDTTYNIDANPANGDIDCKPIAQKKTSSLGFGDDEPHPASHGGNGAASKVTEGEDPLNVTELSTLYSPVQDYYYAQYSKRKDAERRAKVEDRYRACPCPTPNVNHPCIYMDCMAFGMGCSCLQVTMQLPDISSARYCFDQLSVVCPVMLALTSATPSQKGLLADSDVRWMTISSSVDDRQPAEIPRIMKSRYDHVSLFIADTPTGLEQFNDTHVETEAKYYEQLKKEGVDDRLARHVAHLFIRDPLVVYDQTLYNLDDLKRTDHFENIQSTNWQTVRFKPPPFNSDIGWRVEFRVMEVMPTPFENAAFSAFTVLLTRAIHKYKLVFYTLMSAVDECMGRAHRRDPTKQKYTFRKNVFAKDGEYSNDPSEFKEMSVDELINGSSDFIGLLPIVRRVLDEDYRPVASLETMNRLDAFMELIQRRASGELLTTANFFRNFITQHPEYQKDSRVTEAIAYDLVQLSEDLMNGNVFPETYLPEALLKGGNVAKKRQER